MRPDISKPIAAKLEERIRANASYAPPAIVDLAEEHHVAYQTMWKAVRILVDKGVLVAPRGRRIVVNPRVHGKNADAHETSADQFCEKLRFRMVSGEYQVNHPIPKRTFFALVEKISEVTVTRALRRLEREKLVYKRKSRWFAGPGPVQQRQSLSADRSPVILVFISDYADWSLSLQSAFMGKFLAPFYAEAAAHGIRLMPAMREPYPHQAMEIPAGTSEVRATIRSLGSRCLGVLALAQFPKTDNFEKWLRPICAADKPVVYFDNTDMGEYLTRTYLGAGKRYCRFHLDENAAVELALQQFHARGHKVIGVHGAELADWMQRRLDRILTAARRIDPSLRIVTGAAAESIWNPSQGSEMSFVTSTVARDAEIDIVDGAVDSRDQKRFRRVLADRTESLASLIADHNPTALLALNDRMAREYFFWFKAQGREIPRNMSIVGFDNESESILFPLSTVDFGFSRLGYLAAHALIGDLPVRADRQGMVAGVCEFIDRGSVRAMGS